MKTPTQKQLIERWENVLRVLRALTPHQRKKHWDMSEWGVKTNCGTVACAAGHCGLDPWFRRRGFQLNFDKQGEVDFSKFDTFFFDDEGVEEIFYNSSIRSVNAVIREVREHIKTLKAA